MQFFGRKITVSIESPKKETKLFSSEDGFTIEFDNEFGTRATSKIKIWNVLPSTVEMCKPVKDQFSTVELSAGYGEDMYLLTSAKIISVEQKANGVDRVLEINAGARVDVLQNYFSETFENLPVSMILRQMFLKNGIAAYSVRLDNDPLVSNIALNGTIQNALVELSKRASAVWYVQNGKIFIESKDAKAKRESNLLHLSSLSGLIGSPETKGVNLKVRSLLNPNLNYGTLFSLQYKDPLSDKYIEGNYKVLNGKHFGGNRIQSYYTDFECVKQ